MFYIVAIKCPSNKTSFVFVFIILVISISESSIKFNSYSSGSIKFAAIVSSQFTSLGSTKPIKVILVPEYINEIDHSNLYKKDKYMYL